jgi:hypothetical protein
VESPNRGARAALPSLAASTIFGAPIFARSVCRSRLGTIAYGPRAVLLDEGQNPTSSADHDRVKTLHLVLELCPATAIIDLPKANVNGAAHRG